MQCENCHQKHDALYGSGRFCSSKCARGFSTKNRRNEINQKVSKTLKKDRPNVDIVCKWCGKIVSKPWRFRHHKTCGRSCGAKLSNSRPETKEKIRQARIKEIEKGNVGFGIKCSFRGIRCDSALEYAFLVWYWEKYPDAHIQRFAGYLEGEGIKYQPDFLIDNRIIVEVKYDTARVGKALDDKWYQYINSQTKKKKLLEQSGYDFLWVTNKDIGNKVYRQAISDAKKQNNLPS